MRLPRAAAAGSENRAIVFAATLVVGLCAARLDLPIILSHFVVDDSFYYLEIARNLALGRGATFDGLHLTNGFQPLFQVLLVPVFWITTESVRALYLVKAMEAVILACTSVLLFEFTRRLTGSDSIPWLALLLFFLPGPGGLPFNKDLLIAMESGVNAAVLLLLFTMWLRAGRLPAPGMGFHLAYGALIGLTFLARLDNVFLIVALALFHWRQLRASDQLFVDLRRLLVTVAPAALIAGAYLVWNVAQFGHIVPISGRVLAWHSAQLRLSLIAAGLLPWLKEVLWFVSRPDFVSLLPIAGLTAIPVLLRLHERIGTEALALPENARVLLFVLWCASVVKIGYYCFFEGHPYSAKYWYYVPEALLLSVCGAFVLAAFARRLVPRSLAAPARLTALGVMAISAVLISSLEPRFEWENASFQTLPEITQRVPPRALIGAKDAGLLGYFLPNPVINLDGLVNDEEFFGYLQSGKVSEYILERDIGYLVNLVPPTPENIITGWLEEEQLELIYWSERAVAHPTGWVYKLYRVRDAAH